MKICAREDCAQQFSPKTHNQIYCTDACCRSETNKRLMQVYYEEKARRSGQTRLCTTCKTTKLSRYNETKTCSSCTKASKVKANRSVLSMLEHSIIVG